MKIGNLDVLIGSDPELFVKKDGKYISGHTLIPGTKEKPYPVPLGAVQVDGTALEFNTRPAATLQQFHRSTNSVLSALRSMVPDDIEIVASPVAYYGNEYLARLPEKAVELGCSPDFNAYSGKENPTPDVEMPFRTASGHIHIGWTNVENPYSTIHMLECRALVKALDVFLGVPALIIDPDTKRRQLYGKAGAFRPKTYGLEYRVLSNFWVMDPKLRRWVWENTALAIARSLDRNNPLHGRSDVEFTINTGSRVSRNRIIETYKVPVPKGYRHDVSSFGDF